MNDGLQIRAERKGGVPYIKLLLLVFGLAVVAALFYDLRHGGTRRRGPSVASDLQELVLGSEGLRMSDPRGYFSLVPPAGWRVVKFPDSRPYNLSFFGPHATELSIMAVPVDYDDFNSLLRRINRTESRFGMYIDKKPVSFAGYPAVQRMVRLTDSRVLSIDFVAHRVEHHLLFSAPTELFERYLPVMTNLLASYRAETSPSD